MLLLMSWISGTISENSHVSYQSLFKYQRVGRSANSFSNPCHNNRTKSLILVDSTYQPIFEISLTICFIIYLDPISQSITSFGSISNSNPLNLYVPNLIRDILYQLHIQINQSTCRLLRPSTKREKRTSRLLPVQSLPKPRLATVSFDNHQVYILPIFLKFLDSLPSSLVTTTASSLVLFFFLCNKYIKFFLDAQEERDLKFLVQFMLVNLLFLPFHSSSY